MKTATEIITEMAFRYNQGLPIDIQKVTADALLAIDTQVKNIAVSYRDIQLTDTQIKGFMTSAGVKPQSTLTLHSNPPDGFAFSAGGGGYNFVDDIDSPNFTWKILIGPTLAETKANLLAKYRTAGSPENPQASLTTIADFVGNSAVLTAITPGAMDPGYSSLTTQDAAVLSFESGTFGGTRAGVDPTKLEIELLPPPGVGKGYIFQLAGWLVIDTRAGAYTGVAQDGGPSLVMYCAGDSSQSTQLDEGQDAMMTAGGLRGATVDPPESSIDDDGNGNWALKIKNRGRADWQGGNISNTLSLRVYYATVDTEPFGAV